MRCNDISVDVRVSAPLIVCNEAHRLIVAEQAAEINIPVQPLILEPAGRNTAPALTVAALAQVGLGEDPLLLMLPADHVVGNTPDFYQALKTAVQLATIKLFSFGIAPTRATTGYGYIVRPHGEGTSIRTPDPQCIIKFENFRRETPENGKKTGRGKLPLPQYL